MLHEENFTIESEFRIHELTGALHEASCEGNSKNFKHYLFLNLDLTLFAMSKMKVLVSVAGGGAGPFSRA